MARSRCNWSRVRSLGTVYAFSKGRRVGHVVRQGPIWVLNQRGKNPSTHKTLKAAKRAACGR